MNARGTKWFYQESPENLGTLDDLAEHLHSLLSSGTYVAEFPDSPGPILLESKELVERLDGLRIEIRSREHPPPHFHVISSDTNASFTLDECEYIRGNISPKNLKKIQYWYFQKNARQVLIDVWNRTRPDLCVVGEFIEKHL